MALQIFALASSLVEVRQTEIPADGSRTDAVQAPFFRLAHELLEARLMFRH